MKVVFAFATTVFLVPAIQWLIHRLQRVYWDLEMGKCILFCWFVFWRLFPTRICCVKSCEILGKGRKGQLANCISLSCIRRDAPLLRLLPFELPGGRHFSVHSSPLSCLVAMGDVDFLKTLILTQPDFPIKVGGKSGI
jgi:hypothetical protein